MKRPLLLAHRGFSGNYPENSPLAFRMAVEKTAADGFESDVHITKDGKLVIFHDASVERTSNGTGFIKNMTYDELLSLDIGAWKSPEFAGQHTVWHRAFSRSCWQTSRHTASRQKMNGRLVKVGKGEIRNNGKKTRQRRRQYS